jgi:hypothetical protein
VQADLSALQAANDAAEFTAFREAYFSAEYPAIFSAH